MAGWTMSDENDIPSAGIYTFPAGSVHAGAYLVLQRDVDHPLVWGAMTLKLRDQDGVLVDIMDWPKDGAELSYCLIPNGGENAQVCDAETFVVQTTEASASAPSDLPQRSGC